MDEQIEQIARAIAETVAEGDDIDIQEALENHFDWITPEQAKRMIDAAARAAHSVMAGTVAVDESMVDRAMKAFGETKIVGTNFTRRAIRAALVAALAPPRHD